RDSGQRLAEDRIPAGEKFLVRERDVERAPQRGEVGAYLDLASFVRAIGIVEPEARLDLSQRHAGGIRPSGECTPEVDVDQHVAEVKDQRLRGHLRSRSPMVRAARSRS